MSDKILKFKFDRHGLGDVVHFAYAVQLYRSRGYDVTVQVEENKKFLWQVAGVNIVQGGDLPDHAYHYPAGFDDLSQPDYATNKVAFGIRHQVLPKLDVTESQAWDELCAVRLSAHEHIPQEAHDEAERFLEGLPRPIICLHSRGTNWHERKSIPTDVAFDVILKLLDQTTGSVVVLDYDRRAPMVGDARCKGIKPSWGHIPVERLCALLERADLLIGIDSGPFHVAAMTGTKSLGVFRSLHPNRVCLPNPNAVYLVSDRHAEHWSSRQDRWNLAMYAGAEPTADDIVSTAIQVLQGMTKPKESQMLLEQLAGWYDYNRVGHDRRKIELLPNGKIGAGSGDCEYQWFARMEKGVPVIAISGKVGVICDCQKGTDGKFHGRWTQFERMPIELTALGNPDAIDPSRIVLAINWDDGYESVASVVIDNRRQYAARHGYKMHESSYPGSWGKLNCMLNAWNDADWIWWLDADACVTDTSRNLQSIISPNSEYSIIVTCDRNGISCGSMLIRTTDEIKRLFEEILKRRAEFDWPNGLWEQNALMWMLWKMKDRVCILPQETMNSYAEFECVEGSRAWQPGDFVLHCAGLRNEKRIELLTAAVGSINNERVAQ